eukprot:gnl/MRDRNA2_/MRDRNA2_75538_c0_seq1.p2 gnl/MRDRNA2_/MRDRNA2_75538_c0~~gnl/MRDRNA2_/MRDRNA2_75538_c0_seq1.p2  ORF type:complete len:112 (-),score=9.39 gnl/MRDRNA2_/MRDRNA2_75538_c0_seq1:19-354(-)
MEVSGDLQSGGLGNDLLPSRSVPDNPPPATAESLARCTSCQVFESQGVHQVAEGANSSRPVCPLCLESVHGGDEMRVLPCHHNFHKVCVDGWLARYHRTCPLCRADVETTM